MKKIILLLLISGSAWAQQAAKSKYNFSDFMLIEKIEDQEKYYNEMLQQIPADKSSAAITNDYRAELAFRWLSKGNVKRYNHYKETNPKFSPRQFLYLCNALDNLFDEKQLYADVEKITGAILKDLENGTAKDPMGRTEVLMELNAASNAKLGKVDAARKMLAKTNGLKNSSRDIKYFKDSKSNYLNRYAIVMAAAGQYQTAFDTLTKAFREAESNPAMVATFKEIYKKVKGSANGFDNYVKSLKDEAYQKYYKEVEKSYIAEASTTLKGTFPQPDGNAKPMTLFEGKEPVKNISMQNLDGKSVKLGDYNGKILVLDFWTTLCTPCVSAFYGFDKVVAEYKNEPFQMFVVNLFEAEPEVKAYVAQKGITLDVLRDEENAAYNIQGTPTKIVFDPMGNIRFYAAGYAGSTDREYYKLKAMIEITKSRGSGAAASIN